MKKLRKVFHFSNIILFVCACVVAQFIMTAHAEGVKLPDGTLFEPKYYADSNPDVAASLGTSADVLADHYWNHGIQEGRLPYVGANDVSAATVIALVNEYRVSNGLNAFTVDSRLMSAAQTRATELASSQHFAHSRPNGAKWQTVLGSNTSAFSKVGENLGRGQSSASSVVYAWQCSAGHKEVMLHPVFTKVGVGVAKDTNGRFYFALIAGN